MRKTNLLKRVTSALLCIAILLPIFSVFTLVSFASGGDSAVNSTGTSTETIYQNGIYYTIEKTTVYTGNNTYRFDVTLSSTLSKAEGAVTRTAAKNGYFTVDKTGYYMIELWGGSGAEGEDNSMLFLNRPGGEGGARGYLYARIYLEAGQTLVYSIGTNGQQSKRDNEESDGGVNGSGGELGENPGNYGVGAGGGFSALYIFNKGDTFDPAWITDEAVNIPESYRLSRYVMIAGGGGGGGAGNGIAIENAKDKNGNYYTADGGYGGNVMNGSSVTITDADGNVKGYVFAGGDGGSSGTVTSYVGKGGTNRPGTSPSTLNGGYVASPDPNNWTGTASDRSYGAGGGSMFRGGGGGAGYAGGSGGIMEGQMLPECVGGGGGGSSYIAATVGDRAVQYTGFDSETEKYIKGYSACPSSVGGALILTYLGDEAGTSINTSFLNNVSISGSFSEYFEIKNITSTTGATSFSNTAYTFGVSGLDITPADESGNGSVGALSIVFTPKSGFAGGNNIQLIKSTVASFTNAEGKGETVTATSNAASDYVNVGMNIYVKTNSIMTVETGKSYKLTELYVNTYSSVISAFAGGNDPGWEYDFIENLSDYRVYDGQNGAVGAQITSSVTPTKMGATYWSVVLTMTPKTDNGYALVGPRNAGAKDFFGIACVAIIEGEDLSLNGKTVFSNRYLTYDGTAYRMTDEITQTSVGGSYSGASSVYTYAAYGASGASFTATEAGYYLVQAWGSAGGKGQAAKANARRSSSNNHEIVTGSTGYGGIGGAGAAIYGFVYLDAGDTIKMTLSPIGTDYTGSTNEVTAKTENNIFGLSAAAAGTGGGGGGYSAVLLTKADGSITNGVVMVAGGGSGGGGGGSSRTTSSHNSTYTGLVGNASTSVSTGSFDSTYSSYMGSKGNTPTTSNHNTIGVPGVTIGSATAAGTSYKNTSILNVGASSDQTALINALAEDIYNSGGVDKTTYNSYESSLQLGSAVQITSIASMADMENLSDLSSIQIDGQTSKYFEVEDILMSVPGVNYSQRTVSKSGDVTTVSYMYNGSVVYSFKYTLTKQDDGSTVFKITDAAPSPTYEVSADNKTYTATSTFSLSIKLNPRDGFLGGNDVPVLREADGNIPSGKAYFKISGYGDVTYSDANDSVDYANVPISYNLAEDFLSESKTVVYPDYLTEAPLSVNDLYTLGYESPTGNDAWQDDFVKLILPENDSITVDKTTVFDLTAKLLPTVSEPKKALVVGATGGVSATVSPTVTVKYPVNYSVSDLDFEGALFAEYNKELTVTLKATGDFSLPASVTVKVGGVILTGGYSYDSESGVLTVNADRITSPIEIVASGMLVEDETQRFKIYLDYYLYDEEAGKDVLQTQIVREYYLNEKIDYAWFDALAAAIPAREGSTYRWEWEISGGEAPEYMPGSDVYVTGQYVKNRYTVKVNYIDESGVFDTYERAYDFGESYNIPSPVRAGYIADKLTVSGVMGDGPVEVNVTYEKSAKKLIILYIYENGSEIGRYEQELEVGEEYYVETTASIPGYLPDRDVVSGIMTGTDSVTVIVTYSPVKYELNLKYEYASGEYPGKSGYNTVGATAGGQGTITVEYGNIFGYNAELDRYGMPVPLHPNYVFLGWYSDPSLSEDSLITEDMTVSLLDIDTIYAKWEPVKYNLVIRYEYSFDEGDFLPDYTVLPESLEDVLRVEGGEEYTHALSSIVGYTPWKNHGLSTAQKLSDHRLSGTMAGEDTVVYVTYAINVYTVTISDTTSPSDVTYPTYTSFVSTPDVKRTYYTITVKHGANAVFSGVALFSNTSEEYTFYHIGSYRNTETDEVFSLSGEGSTLTLPKVYNDIEYSALCSAVENIAVVTTSGGAVSYYSSVREAVDRVKSIAASSSSSAPTLRFRRNADVEKVIDLDAIDPDYPTIALDTVTGIYVNVDLGGCRIKTSDTAIRNTTYLTVTDSVGGGRIEAIGSVVDSSSSPAAIYGIYSSSGSLSFDSSLKDCDYDLITVISENGGLAKGVYSSTTLTFYGSVLVETAGSAYGVQAGSTLSVYGDIEVTGGSTAYGAYGTTLYIYSGSDLKVTTTGTAIAYGAYASSSGVYTYAPSTIDVRSNEGYAYGIYASSTSYLNYSGNGSSTITAYSENSGAYGAYTSSNYIYANYNGTSGQSSDLTINVRSDSELTSVYAYGIRSSSTAYINYNSSGSGDLMIIVSSAAATAYGVYAGSNYLYFNYNYGSSAVGNAEVNVTTLSGTAYGLYRAGSVYTNYNNSGSGNSNVNVLSTDGNAYGAYGSTVYVNSQPTRGSHLMLAVSENGIAYGAYSTGAVTLNAGADITAYSEKYEGAEDSMVAAYGMYVTTSLTANSNTSADPSVVRAVSGKANATGIYIKAQAAALYYFDCYATAPEGVAIGLDVIATNTTSRALGSSSYYLNATAVGDIAIAVEADLNTTSYVNATASGVSGAYALRAGSTTSRTHSIYGTLVANATGGDAYGILGPMSVSLTATSEVFARASDTAYGIKDATVSSFTLGSTVTVMSDGGNAYGIDSDASIPQNTSVTVVAAGVAYGFFVDAASALNVYGVADVTGASAYAFYLAENATVSTNGYTALSAASTGASDSVAYGVYISEGATLSHTSSDVLEITATAAYGASYGIYNAGAISAICASVGAYSELGAAYGLYNCGTVVAQGSSMDLVARSDTDYAYGIYNIRGMIGEDADGLYLATGSAAGISASGTGYGIYSAEGTVYLTGDDFYFKGTTLNLYGIDTGAIVVPDGYIEQLGADQTKYPGYYVVIYVEYYIEFIDVIDGVEKNRVTVAYNSATTQIYEPEFVGKIGHQGAWGAYDFTPPAEGNTKQVYSSYSILKFTISLNYGGGTGSVASITQDYNTAVSAPANPTRAGYTFVGWYADEALSVKYVFTTIPAENITVFAAWDANSITITFNTGGGTEIGAVTGDCDTIIAMPSDPVRIGSAFLGWYTDSGYTNLFTSLTFPTSDITLYAKWSLTTFLAVSEAYKSYTVVFYRNESSSDNTVVSTVNVSGDGLQTVTIPTVTHSTDTNVDKAKYAFCGWYTSRTISSNTYADLHGSLATLDAADGTTDGNVSLYAGWKSLTRGRDRYELTTERGTYYTINKSVHDGSSTNKYSYLYATYNVDTEGDYVLSYLNYKDTTGTSTYYYKYLQVQVISLDGTTRTLLANTGVVHTRDKEDYNEVELLGLKRGDVIVMRSYEYGGSNDTTSYNSDIYAYLSVTPELDQTPLSNTANYVEYNVERGTVALTPLAAKGTRKFLGWTWMVDGALSDEYINEIDVSLLSTMPAWQDHSSPGVLYLYPLWEEISVEWTSSVESGRLFSTFTSGKTDVAIRQNNSFTVLLSAVGDDVSSSIAKMTFSKGLPAGTILTLIDLSGQMPTYYTYTVGSGGAKEISFDSFSRMGNSSEKFSGCSALMLVNVCYANANNTVASEVLRLYVDGEITTAADNTVTFIDTTPQQTVYSGTVAMPHTENPVQSTYVPALQGMGFSEDARVLFVMRFENSDGSRFTFPAGLVGSLSGNYETLVYSDMIVADVGSVSDFGSGGYLYGTLMASALRYTDFSGKVISEIIVLEGSMATDICSYQGLGASVVSGTSINYRVSEPPRITATVTQPVLKRGDIIEVILSNANGALCDELVSVQLLQLVNGELVPTENVLTLLDEQIYVDTDGFVFGGTAYTDGNGKMNVPVGALAEEGVYYARFLHNDRYDVVIVEVVADQ